MIEIWKAIGGRKTYIVASRAEDPYELGIYARRYFRSAADKITIQQAWIYNDKLYLEDPHKSKAKRRLVAYLKRKGE
jgi:hypothetical protein